MGLVEAIVATSIAAAESTIAAVVALPKGVDEARRMFRVVAHAHHEAAAFALILDRLSPIVGRHVGVLAEDAAKATRRAIFKAALRPWANGDLGRYQKIVRAAYLEYAVTALQASEAPTLLSELYRITDGRPLQTIIRARDAINRRAGSIRPRRREFFHRERSP